jgi:hypothetical protein
MLRLPEEVLPSMVMVASSDLSDCSLFEASRRACCAVAVVAGVGLVAPPEAADFDAVPLDAEHPAAGMAIPPIAMARDGTRVTREYTEALRSGPPGATGGQVSDYVAIPLLPALFISFNDFQLHGVPGGHGQGGIKTDDSGSWFPVYGRKAIT